MQGDDQQQRRQTAVNEEKTTMETSLSLRGRRGSTDSYDHVADVYKDDALRAKDQNQTITVNGAGSLFSVPLV